MVDILEKPTEASIKQIHAHLTRLWAEAHTIFKMVDPYYERTFPLWATGSNRPNLHPMKPRSIIDTALDQLMGHEAQVHRFGEDEGKQTQRDQVEKAMNAIFRQAALQEVSLSFKQAGKHILMYGYGIIEDSLDGVTLSVAKSERPKGEDGEDEEELGQRVRLWEHRKKTAMPFRIRAPHPVTVLMDPMRKEPRVAIKVDRWTAQDLVDITKLRKEQGRGDVELFEPRANPFDLVEAFEYWTADWHALMTSGTGKSGGFLGFGGTPGIPGQLLIVEPNTWGFVPFSHAFSGWGQEPSDRTTMNPKYLAVGMLQHAMDDLKMHAQAIAGRHNALMDATFAKTGTTEEPTELEEQMATSDTIQLPQEAAMWTIKAPQLPRWLETLGVVLDKDIEEGTFTRSLGGVRDVGVSTVGQQAILNVAGQRKFVPINTQMQHLGTKSLEHILQWIDILNLNLTVEGHNIKRSMIGGDYSGRVTFHVVDPVLQLQERQQALTEWQAGARGLESLWSVMGLEDAAGERQRMAQDQVYAHPTINDEMVKIEAQRLGLLKLLLGQQNGQTPGPGAGTVESGQPTLVGPDGRPIQTTLQGGTGQTGEQLRQPITGQVARPSRAGQNLAG